MSTSQFRSTLQRLAESKADAIREMILQGGLNKNAIAKATDSNYTQVHNIYNDMLKKGTVQQGHLPMGKAASTIMSGDASTAPSIPKAVRTPSSSEGGESKSQAARRLWTTTDMSIGAIARDLGMHYSHAWQTVGKLPRGNNSPDTIEGETVPSTGPSLSTRSDNAIDAEFDEIVPGPTRERPPGVPQLGNGPVASIRNPASRLGGGGASSDSQIPLGNGRTPELGNGTSPTRSSPDRASGDSMIPLGNGPRDAEPPVDRDPMVAATTGRNSALADKIADKTLELVSIIDDVTLGNIVTGVLDSPAIRSLADTMSSADLETLIRSVVNRLVKSGDLANDGGSLSIPDFNDDIGDGPDQASLEGDDYDQDISDLMKKAEGGDSAYDIPDEDKFGDDDDDDGYGAPRGRRRADDDWMADWQSGASNGGRRSRDEDY